MTVHQISIFVENKSGTLLRVLDLFKEAFAHMAFFQAAAGVFHFLLFLPQLFQPQLGLFHIGVHLVVCLGIVTGVGVHAAVLRVTWSHMRKK